MVKLLNAILFGELIRPFSEADEEVKMKKLEQKYSRIQIASVVEQLGDIKV